MTEIKCDRCKKIILPEKTPQFLIGIIVEKKISMMEKGAIFGLPQLPGRKPPTFLEQFEGKEIRLCYECLEKFKKFLEE